MRLTHHILAAGWCLVGCMPTSFPKPEVAARVQSVQLPPGLEVDPASQRVLWIEYTLGRGDFVPPLEVVLRGEESASRVLPIFAQTAPTEALLTGRGSVGVDLVGLGLGSGTYELCLAPQEDRGEEQCGLVELFFLVGDCYERYQLAAEQAQGYACSCVSAEIRNKPTQAPHSDLGQFTAAVGGNVLGPFDAGNVSRDPTFSSMFKFEAHFKVAVENAPPRPGVCPEWLWEWLVMSVCKEGQEVNGTHSFMGELSNGKKFAKQTKKFGKNMAGDFTTAPFKAGPAAKFLNDGYTVPSPLSPDVAACAIGVGKNYLPPDVIHWLDAPGVCAGPSARAADQVPMSTAIYLHSFVHGTDETTDTDDCDCYFEVRNTAIAENGAVQPSSMGAPVCR